MTFLPMTSHDELTSSGGFTAYAQWYALRDELVPYIGERATALFSFAISDENKCVVSASYLRKVLTDSGENVDDPQVTEAEQLLMDWGRLIARAPHDIPAEMYARLESSFNPKLRLILVAFAGQMVATNLFNTVGKVPLDPELEPFAP